MSSILVINAAGRETRVALVENGHIAEFYLERKKDKGVVGNIYKGRVTRVLPGMQAAFVDVGLDKAAFLYVTDVFYDPEFSRQQFELTEGEHDEQPEVPDVDTEDNAADAHPPIPGESPPSPSGEHPNPEAGFETAAEPSAGELPAPSAPQPDAAVTAPSPSADDALPSPISEAASAPSGAEVIAAAVDA